MGLRLRLKANIDISSFSPTDQVILTALKHYGMFVADNGSSWYLSGAPDNRWNNNDLHLLDKINGSDFEAVDESSLQVSPNSGKAKQPSTTSSNLGIKTPVQLSHTLEPALLFGNVRSLNAVMRSQLLNGDGEIVTDGAFGEKKRH